MAQSTNKTMGLNISSRTITCQQYISSLTGSSSSKYEHRQASALLANIQNIRICMGKKPIVSVTDENERISIKNSLPYLKCVLRQTHKTAINRPADHTGET